MGTKHFGMVSVSGRRRVPCPAASKKAFNLNLPNLRGWQESPLPTPILVIVYERIIHDYLNALNVDGECHLLNIGLPLLSAPAAGESAVAMSCQVSNIRRSEEMT
jgi:hypothetical protein